MFVLKYDYVSAVEGASDGSSEGTSTYEVKIKGAHEVVIELHLKMHMVMHQLVEKSTQNDSIKGELEETLCVALEGAPKISFKEAQKIAKKCEEKDAFGVAVDGPLDGAIKGAPLNLTFCSLCILYILQSAE